MFTISVCVGSSCHLKGAYEIIKICQELIEKHQLEGKVELKGTFCCGKCSEQGVTVIINGETLSGVLPSNFEEVFQEKVLKEIQNERH
ncbi:MAG: hypothetical protein PWP60_575 [Candidatus Atribacteria bacterium]|jgi:NADH-quinone oxidoreductase subunit G|nr:hypothetical protein [Candidatus Atribacteria bacterium]